MKVRAGRQGYQKGKGKKKTTRKNNLAFPCTKYIIMIHIFSQGPDKLKKINSYIKE